MEPNAPKTILIVDDSKQNLKLMTEVLEPQGYTVLQALKGAVGLEVAKRAHPDLVLLDICMPEMDGFETCRKFKSDPLLQEIPIIFLSGLTEQQEKVKAFENGGVDYIEKPVNPPEVLARVHTHIQLHRMQISLADMVKERTDQLVEANQALKEEILQRKKAEKKLRLDEERLESLLNLNEKDFDSENQVIEEVLEEAVRLTSSTMGYFHFVHEDCRDIRLSAWSKSVRKDCSVAVKEKYPIGEAGIWADCLRHKKPVVHNDYAGLEDKNQLPDGHVSIRRHMSIPVFKNKEVVAIIGVGNKDDAYDTADIRQLTLFSQGMWRLIDRIRYEKARADLEAQLHQAQKMEAIGTLAGGIAHDFNNILTPILGYAELEISAAPKDSPSYDNLKELWNAGQRARELVGQILNFSRKSEDEIRPILLQPVVKEVLKLLNASLPSTIKIEKRIDPDCGYVLGNAVQIHQIVMNLCTNAYHAMKGQNGLLRIVLAGSGNEGLDGLELPGGNERRGIMLSVSDTGCGMAKDVMDKMFDPYFTTKEKQEGTGLGLSVVHSIVGRLGGNIWVDSDVGQGTKVRIFLPVINTGEVEKSKWAKSGTSPLPGGDEHILVVDDELYVIRVITQILTSLGYRVSTSQGSDAALHLFGQAPDSYDMVLTDLTMPGMTGLQLTRELLAIRKDLPVILCTGYSERIEASDLKALGIRDIQLKPILRKELAHAIRRILDKT